jgi:hypothetical protein
MFLFYQTNLLFLSLQSPASTKAIPCIFHKVDFAIKYPQLRIDLGREAYIELMNSDVSEILRTFKLLYVEIKLMIHGFATCMNWGN